MLDKYIAVLKEKRLYEVTMGLGLFIIFLIVNKLFTLPVFLLPFLVFVGFRIFLKTKVKAENQPLVNSFALQFAHYLMILIAAFRSPFTKIIDFFVIFWGSNWLWKKPSWRSGGLMIAYNLYLIFGYILGLNRAIQQNNLNNIRYSSLFLLISLASIYFTISGIRAIQASSKEDNSGTGEEADVENIQDIQAEVKAEEEQ